MPACKIFSTKVYFIFAPRGASYLHNMLPLDFLLPDKNQSPNLFKPRFVRFSWFLS